MSHEAKRPMISDGMRVALFLMFLAFAGGGVAAALMGEGAFEMAGQAAIGLSIVLAPMVFWVAFHGPGLSGSKQNRQGAFDGSYTGHFDAIHDQRSDLEKSQGVDRGVFVLPDAGPF